MKIRLEKLAAALFALVMISAPALAQTKVTIAVGGGACLCYLPTVLARQLGEYEKAALAVELVDLKGGSDALKAVLGGSTATVTGKLNFKANAIVRNVLAGTACSIPLQPGWTCNSPQLNGQYADTAGWVTAEANNLYYAPDPNWVLPQVPQSEFSCSGGFCWMQAYELYPK